MPDMDQPLATAMFVDRNRVFIGQNDHTWVVLHKTAGFHTAQQVAQFFATDPNMASTHYVVGQDGTIVQCVLEVDGAGGNCCLETGHAPYLPLGVNLNVKTVSIEHVDPATDNSTPLTDAQKAASFTLVRDICLRHNIPMRPGDKDGGIIGHHDIAPLSRARCPGNYPMEELFAFLQNGGDGTMGVPQGWNDQNGVLTAPNGLHVKGGFRDYILSHGWDPNDWPLEEEMQLGSLEDSNPTLGAGAQQIFRMSMLGATASRGVFKEWLGQELVTQRANVAKYYQRWQDALKAQPPATDTSALQAELTKYKTMAHQIALIVQGE